MAIEEPNNWCQSENSLTHGKFPLQIMKPIGGLAGECVFIDRRAVDCAVGKVGANTPEMYITCNVWFPSF